VKHLLTFFIFVWTTFLLAQENTEVYLINLDATDSAFKVENFRNISNNTGYNNQPYFLDSNQIVYAKTRKGQTDVARYNIATGETQWRTHTLQGSEYSPSSPPSSNSITAVRLDTTGLQRLYRYDHSNDEGTELAQGLQVAYYTFVTSETILASVLGIEGLDLVAINNATQQTDTLAYNAGRSLHHIPNTAMVSYTYVNEQGQHDIYQFDFETKESYFVVQLPVGVQDHIWIDESRLLLGSGTKLFLYDLFGNGFWKEVADFSEQGISNINRMAISPNGKHLALVAQPKS
jgi:hypothetical protein